MPPQTRKETSSDKPEATPDATPAPEPATEPAPAAEPENPGQDVVPSSSDEDAAEESDAVRLVPGDWTVTSYEFPTGEASEDGEPVRVTVHRDVPYIVTDAEADALIAAAASHGFVLIKEPVA